MRRVSRSVVLSAAMGFLLVTGVASAAPAAPKGAHPRLFLGSKTLAAIKAKASASGSAVASAIAKCKDVAAKPSDYQKSGYQGDNWAFPLSACALAYQATGDASHVATAIKLWNASLNDVDTMGDGQACTVGADATKSIASVKRDTGYAIRFLGPHTALAYDWLHDAPGVDEALRSHTRACFRVWIDWYTKEGYLNDVPGANYNAGYVAAKTFIAVAEGGEAGSAGDADWSQVVDDIFGKQLVGEGLAQGGVLQGGDWAEGWQYGPLSVLEYALAARALEEQGASVAPMHGWSNDLTARLVYGLLPTQKDTYVGGDTDSDTPWIDPNVRIVEATIAGLGSDEAAGYAEFLRQHVTNAKDEDSPAFAALTEARSATAVDPATKSWPLAYLAKGTRNFYVRTSWKSDALWAVFTSSPRQVPDHQHMDASNFVLVRGADSLIVDPSPYGSRSSLTSNAVTVDSNIAKSDYKPSQTPWSEADLAWAKATQGGVAVARADFAKAFIFSDTPSDVPFAVRDWVFLPEGEVVAIDRTRTDSADRKTYVRFRTPAKLALSGNVASGTVGGSKVAIHAVQVSGGTPSTKSYPAASDCSDPPGACDAARLAVDELSVTIPGPQALAIHAIDALGSGDAPSDATSMQDVDATKNAGVVGTKVTRGDKTTYVVASAAKDGVASSIEYWAKGAARHVVVDRVSKTASVQATADGDGCKITVHEGEGTMVGDAPYVFTVDASCAVSLDGDAPTAPPDAGSTPVDPNANGAGPDGSGDVTGGCGCRTSARAGGGAAILALAALAFALGRRRRSV